MFSFAYGISDKIEIEGKNYTVNLSYDNVLRLLDLLADETISDTLRLNIAIQMLIGKGTIKDDAKVSVVQQIIKQYIMMEKPATIVATLEEPEEKKKWYSLKEDADIIYASFIADYGIDLFSVRGELHWFKFKALLNNLSEETKFCQVIKIRQWKPTKHTSKEEKESMAKLQRFYSLEISQKDAEEFVEFLSLSEEERQKFAKNKLKERGMKNG